MKAGIVNIFDRILTVCVAPDVNQFCPMKPELYEYVGKKRGLLKRGHPITVMLHGAQWYQIDSVATKIELGAGQIVHFTIKY